MSTRLHGSADAPTPVADPDPHHAGPRASSDDSPVADLVREARAGRTDAWNELVERYAPLVRSVVRRYRLQASDGEDVVQTLWLRLVEHLDDIRDPQALPGWIATTVRNECLRTLRSAQRVQPFDPLLPADDERPSGPRLVDGTVPVDDGVVDVLDEAGRHEALLLAFAELPDSQRRLLTLLMADPPLPYAEISDRLGMPIGSIGPLRGRALERIRRHPAVRALASGGSPQHA